MTVEDLFWFYNSNMSTYKKNVQIFLFFCFPLILYKAPHKLSGEDAGADECDRASFVNLLTRMLTVDATERITPNQILQHPFITMSHIVGTFDNSPQ